MLRIGVSLFSIVMVSDEYVVLRETNDSGHLLLGAALWSWPRPDFGQEAEEQIEIWAEVAYEQYP